MFWIKVFDTIVPCFCFSFFQPKTYPSWQEEVYEYTCSSPKLVDALIQGVSVSILAYGATGQSIQSHTTVNIVEKPQRVRLPKIMMKSLNAVRKRKWGVCRYVKVHVHNFATQSSHSVDLAGWQAKMASIECWIPWRYAHKPHCRLGEFVWKESWFPFVQELGIMQVFLGLRSKNCFRATFYSRLEAFENITILYNHKRQKKDIN